MGSIMWTDLTLIVAKEAVQLLGVAPQEENSVKRSKIKTLQWFLLLLKEKYGDAPFCHLQEWQQTAP